MKNSVRPWIPKSWSDKSAQCHWNFCESCSINNLRKEKKKKKELTKLRYRKQPEKHIGEREERRWWLCLVGRRAGRAYQLQWFGGVHGFLLDIIAREWIISNSHVQSELIVSRGLAVGFQIVCVCLIGRFQCCLASKM